MSLNNSPERASVGTDELSLRERLIENGIQLEQGHLDTVMPVQIAKKLNERRNGKKESKSRTGVQEDRLDQTEASIMGVSI